MPSLDNYVSLCQTYGSYLLGLGGVTITILTLVLTLKRDNARKAVLPDLVAALVVCAAACFIGTHLLNEAACLTGEPPVTAARPGELPIGNPPGIIRFFWIAEVNIFIAALSFLFALALITLVYSEEGITEMALPVAFTVLLPATVFALFWVCNPLTLLVRQYMMWAALVATATFVCTAGISYHVAGGSGRARHFPFMAPTLVAVASMWLFGFTAGARRAPDLADLFFLVIGASVPAGAFGGSGFKLFLNDVRQRQGEGREVPSGSPPEPSDPSLAEAPLPIAMSTSRQNHSAKSEKHALPKGNTVSKRSQNRQR